jgi:hypothetical protein
VAALGGDGCVHAARVEIEPVELVGGQDGDGAVGGGAQLQGALQAVVLQHGAAKNGGKLAGGVAAQQVHLPQAVLCGDVALREDEVVHGGGVDVGHAARVAGNRDRRGKAVDGERAIELRQVLAHCITDEVASGEESRGGETGEEQKKEGEEAQPAAPARRSGRGCERGGWCGGTIRRGVCCAAAFHLAHESPVAQFGLAGIGGGGGLAGVWIVAAHGLWQV